jgi:hypothetical protein
MMGREAQKENKMTRKIVTVGRYGQKMATFRSGGHTICRPIWAVKIYVERNGKWALCETLDQITKSGTTPSDKFQNFGRSVAVLRGLEFWPWTQNRAGRIVHGVSTAL